MLTPAERNIARYIALGSSNKEIARAMGLTERTIKFHVSNLLRKHKCQNRTQLATTLKREKLEEEREKVLSIFNSLDEYLKLADEIVRRI